MQMMRTERSAMQLLGLKHIADATRVLNMVRSVVSGNGLPPAVDITVPGEDKAPGTWSVEQLCQHVSGGALGEAAELLKTHKFAGDVIGAMSLDGIFGLLELKPKLEDAFFEVMEALRAQAATSL